MANLYITESLLLELNGDDTLSYCRTHKEAERICKDPAFWRRKALNKYRFDIDKITLNGSNSAYARYAWLEDNLQTPWDNWPFWSEHERSVKEKLVEPDLGAYNTYYWHWRAKRDFNVDPDDFDAIKAEENMSALGTYSVIALSKEVPPDKLIKHLKEYDLRRTLAYILTYGVYNWSKGYKKKILPYHIANEMAMGSSNGTVANLVRRGDIRNAMAVIESKDNNTTPSGYAWYMEHMSTMLFPPDVNDVIAFDRAVFAHVYAVGGRQNVEEMLRNIESSEVLLVLANAGLLDRQYVKYMLSYNLRQQKYGFNYVDLTPLIATLRSIQESNGWQ